MAAAHGCPVEDEPLGENGGLQPFIALACTQPCTQHYFLTRPPNLD